MMRYSESYSENLKEAKDFQDYVEKLLRPHGIELHCYTTQTQQYHIGENPEGVEIKLDRLRKMTHRLYIETAEKSNPNKDNYTPSGIFRQDNTHTYAIGDYEILYLFDKKKLQECHQQNKRTHWYKETKTSTSLGFLLPEIDAYELAEVVFKNGVIMERNSL